MTYLWSEGDRLKRNPPPPDELCAQIDAALTPIKPMLRGLEWETDQAGQGFVRVLLGLGPDFDLLSVTAHDAHDVHVTIDLPVGEVPLRLEALLAVLHANVNNAWKYRVDQVTEGQAVVVLEYRAPLDFALARLGALVWQGWRERALRQAPLQQLFERGDA